MKMMRAHRSLIVISGVLLVAVATILYALPTVARHVAISRLQTITKRPVSIERVDVHLLSSRFTIHGLRVAEPDGGAPFADTELIQVRLRLLPLVRGHIWVRELIVRKPVLRIVRFGKNFNLSDLIESSGTIETRVDVTVDRFSLVDGTVAFEDRALSERRTWTSEDIKIEASNVSTLRDDGTVVASSVTAGAPNFVSIEQFRLYPIHLKAVVTVTGLDLALARLYLPADGQIVLDRGRVSSTLEVVFDARDEVRAALTGELEDLVLIKPGEREPVARIPKLTARLSDFTLRNEQIRVGLLELKGSANVRDPRASQGARYQVSTIRASIADLTWPIVTPGKLDVLTAIPGGGTLAVTGALMPPPAASQLHLNLKDVDLTPWNRFLPIAARLSGRGEADLRVDAPLAAGVPTHVNGSIAVNRLGIRDGQQELVGAQRVEAAGLEVRWPTRLGVKRLVVTGPRVIVERDKQGGFPLMALAARPPTARTPAAVNDTSKAGTSPPQIDIDEVAVRNGVLSWRDETVTPRATLDISEFDVAITGGGWPLRPVGVKLAVRPPGGGQIRVAGRVGVDPFKADLHVTAHDAELAHYQPYVPIRARFSGRADLDLAIVLPDAATPNATVRGTAALSQMDVRDGQRTVLKVDRAAATALDVDWPRAIKVGELTLRQPWVLLERDPTGALPLRAFLVPETAARTRPPTAAATNDPTSADSPRPPLVLILNRLVVEGGGARLVDERITPPFAVDVADLAARIDGVSTVARARPARVELSGRVGDGLLRFAGTVGPVTGPLRLDVHGELRQFAVPRTNPYLLNGVAWEARNGWLTTSIEGRIDGDTLEARADVLVSRLQLARVAGQDEAQTRLGLPLGMITSLMKDRHGDIHLALPIGGRVNDPRFDFRELIWSTVRNAALKVITGPVSLIGRVKTGADSHIQQIEIDPVRFEDGTATPTAEGQEQLSRLVAFLDQTTATRLTATAVISRSDLNAMNEPTVDSKAVSTLAGKRLDLVRTTVKKAGIDDSRLLEAKRIDSGGDVAPAVKLDLAEPESPGRAARRTSEPGRSPAQVAEAEPGTPR
jgi:uncharacterized protein involved in outer membrane biogenesis